MKPITLVSTALLLALGSTAASEPATIDVGGTILSIPAPAGFALVTTEMTVWREFQEKLVPADNQQFIAFVPAALAEQALAGGPPMLERQCYIQTARPMVNYQATLHEFAQLKDMLKSQIGDMMKKVESEMPGYLEKVNQGIAESYDADIDLGISGMIPLPFHEESERMLSYSMLATVTSRNEAGETERTESLVTTTVALLRGKVLFLYASAPPEERSACEAASHAWVTAVMAANPSEPQEAAAEAQPRERPSIWRNVGKTALIGAIIGAFVSLIRTLVSRRKKSV